jgi:hypothetical protein
MRLPSRHRLEGNRILENRHIDTNRLTFRYLPVFVNTSALDIYYLWISKRVLRSLSPDVFSRSAETRGSPAIPQVEYPQYRAFLQASLIDPARLAFAVY